MWEPKLCVIIDIMGGSHKILLHWSLHAIIIFLNLGSTSLVKNMAAKPTNKGVVKEMEKWEGEDVQISQDNILFTACKHSMLIKYILYYVLIIVL